jgi:ABC-type transport system involved in multi-copper enzyme maturation permease subunit
MKQLLWKEWMEQRVLLLSCAAGIVFLLVFMVRVDTVGAVMRDVAPAVWTFLGIIAGCGLFTTEATSGTLQFLTTLPVLRAKVWLAKIMVGGSCVLLMTAVCAPIWAYVSRVAYAEHYGSAAPTDYWSEFGYGLAYVLFGFTLGLVVSPLADRVATSLLTSVFGAILVTMIAHGLSVTYSPGPTPMAPAIYLTFILVSIAVFLAASYRTIVHGESLRSSRRFRIAGPILLGWALVSCAAVKFGAPLLWQ